MRENGNFFLNSSAKDVEALLTPNMKHWSKGVYSTKQRYPLLWESDYYRIVLFEDGLNNSVIHFGFAKEQLTGVRKLLEIAKYKVGL